MCSCRPSHRQMGEQVFENNHLCDHVRKRTNKILGERFVRLLKFIITALLPGRSTGLHVRRLLRLVIVTKASTISPFTNNQYMHRIPVYCFTMTVVEFAPLLFMRINTSSILWFHSRDRSYSSHALYSKINC